MSAKVLQIITDMSGEVSAGTCRERGSSLETKWESAECICTSSVTWTPGVGRAWNCCLSHVFCKSRFDIVVGVECWCSELAVQLLEHESRRVQTCTLLELLYVMDFGQLHRTICCQPAYDF